MKAKQEFSKIEQIAIEYIKKIASAKTLEDQKKVLNNYRKEIEQYLEANADKEKIIGPKNTKITEAFKLIEEQFKIYETALEELSSSEITATNASEITRKHIKKSLRNFDKVLSKLKSDNKFYTGRTEIFHGFYKNCAELMLLSPDHLRYNAKKLFSEAFTANLLAIILWLPLLFIGIESGLIGFIVVAAVLVLAFNMTWVVPTVKTALAKTESGRKKYSEKVDKFIDSFKEFTSELKTVDERFKDFDVTLIDKLKSLDTTQAKLEGIRKICYEFMPKKNAEMLIKSIEQIAATAIDEKSVADRKGRANTEYSQKRNTVITGKEDKDYKDYKAKFTKDNIGKDIIKISDKQFSRIINKANLKDIVEHKNGMLSVVMPKGIPSALFTMKLKELKAHLDKQYIDFGKSEKLKQFFDKAMPKTIAKQ